MASEHPQIPPASPGTDPSLTPITELHDPRAIQILNTEHWACSPPGPWPTTRLSFAPACS